MIYNHIQRYLHQTVAMILRKFFIFLIEYRESLILPIILQHSLNFVADHIGKYGNDIEDILERITVRRKSKTAYEEEALDTYVSKQVKAQPILC